MSVLVYTGCPFESYNVAVPVTKKLIPLSVSLQVEPSEFFILLGSWVIDGDF